MEKSHSLRPPAESNPPSSPDGSGEFHSPSFQEPLDVAEEIERTPSTSTAKGFILSDIAAIAQRAGHDLFPNKRWVPFKDYATRELMAVQVEVARALYPDKPLRAGLRCVGQHVYPAFAESLVGRAIFSFAGDQLGLALRLSERAYQVAGRPANVKVLSQVEGRVVLRHVVQYNFLDCLQVGIFEGAIMAFNVEGSVRVRMLGPSTADFEVVWKNREP